MNLITNLKPAIEKSGLVTKTIKIMKLTLVFLIFAFLQANAKGDQQKKSTSIKVNGKITDDKGQPLEGATILLKGTRIGTKSDGKGDFSINADANSILIISYIGFESTEVKVGGRTYILVQLNASIAMGDKIVVTALGIKREERALGYSVQKVTGDMLQKVSGVDVATSLTGKVAGVLVKNSSDFAAVPQVNIRGESDILLVVDGIPYANKSLTDISSEDIESMSVLKGATASALYGFRGRNGAILITTKNGSSNKGGLTVDYSTNTMFTAGYLAIPKKQSVYGRGKDGIYDINSDNSWGPKMDGTIQNQWNPITKDFETMPYLPVGKNNFKNFLNQGYITNNDLSVGFKTDKLSIRNSLNWIQNKGRYPNSTLDKYTYSLGADVNLNKFKMSSNFSYSRKHSPNIGSNGYTSYDPMYTLLIWSPSDFNILDYKNNYWITKGIQQNYIYGINPDGSYSGAIQNDPYFDRYERTNEVSRDIFNADLSMSYQIVPWLKATVRSGIDFYKEVGQLRISKGSFTYSGNTPVPGNLYTWNGYKDGGYVIGQNSGLSSNSDLLLTGDRKYKDFNFEYLAGGTIFYKRDDNIYANTNGGIAVPGFFSIKASVTPASINQSTYAQQVNSVFGRLGISWRRLIYVDATARNDWSSTLSKSNRSYFYPSVAGSFIVSELLTGTKNWLDLLKLRSSFAVSKAPAGIYQINSSYALNNGIWNTLNGAVAPSLLYPAGLIPQASNTLETGVQAIFFKNRLNVDISHYDKRNYDGIISGPITAASGYTGIETNTKEETKNKGWEIILGGTAIKSKDWQLDLGVNWSTYKQTYWKLDSVFSAKKPWVKVGERTDPFISRDFLHDPSGNLIYNSSGRIITSSYGSKFGYINPDFVWGMNSTLRYKNISLFISVDGVKGGLADTRTESYLWQSGNHPNSVTPERALDVATPGSKNYLGQGVKVVSGAATYDAFGNITSDTRTYAPNDVYSTYKQAMIDLHNSSAWGGNGTRPDTYSKTFFKLREISISYNVPDRLLHGIARAASVSFIGQNVLLKAKQFKYSDPDGGSEDFSDPAVRYLGFKVNLTF